MGARHTEILSWIRSEVFDRAADYINDGKAGSAYEALEMAVEVCGERDDNAEDFHNCLPTAARKHPTLLQEYEALRAVADTYRRK